MNRNASTSFPDDAPVPVGEMLRRWRMQRRLSQLDLANVAEISTRHLSFLETGRSQPSREMVLKLTDRLKVPLRERNGLLLAAGYAPMYRERPLSDPALTAARRALDLVLKGHEPYPAIAVDRHWNLVAMNRAAPMLLAGAAERLLQPPINILRAALHPEGISTRIVNLAQTRHHLLGRLQTQIEASNDVSLVELMAELSAFPGTDGHEAVAADHPGVMVPIQLRAGEHVLSFFSTLTVFGSPLEITISELAVEAFLPADDETADYLREAFRRTDDTER